MKDHPELYFWKKCPCCGYSEVNTDLKNKHPNSDINHPRENIIVLDTEDDVKKQN
jgi:hypothetical protein